MASILLGAVGSYAASALGLAAGGFAATALSGGLSLLGAFIDAKLFAPSQGPGGARLEDLKITDGSQGVPIPLGYGQFTTGGNVIWSTPRLETEHDNSSFWGIISSPSTYTYSVSFAIAICAGPIGGVRRIWADGKLAYDSGKRAPDVRDGFVCDGITIYNGYQDGTDGYPAQDPDPLIESYEEVGNVPAYRGVAYVVFENLQLENYGNRIPNLTFEVIQDASFQDWFIAETETVTTAIPCGVPQVFQNKIYTGFLCKGVSGWFCRVVVADTNNPANILQTVDSSAFADTSGAFVGSSISWTPNFVINPNGTVGAFLFSLNNDLSTTQNQWVVIYKVQDGSFGARVQINTGGFSPSSSLQWCGGTNSRPYLVIPGSNGNVRAYTLTGAGSISSATDVALTGALSFPNAQTSHACLASGTVNGTKTLGVLITNTNTSSGLFRCWYLYYGSGGWQSVNLGTPSGTLPSDLDLSTASVVPLASAAPDGDVGLSFAVKGGGSSNVQICTIEANLTLVSVRITRNTVTRSFAGGGTVYYPYLNFSQPRNALFYVEGATSPATKLYLSELELGASSFVVTKDKVAIEGTYALPALPGTGPLPFPVTAGPATDSSYFIVAGSSTTNSPYGRVPTVDATVAAAGPYLEAGASLTLQYVVEDLLARAGYDSSEYDASDLAADTISGYLIDSPTNARAAIEPLTIHTPFDLIQVDNQLVAIKRPGTYVDSIEGGMLDAREGGAQSESKLITTIPTQWDLPRSVSLTHINIDREYQQGQQRVMNSVSPSATEQQITLPIVMTGSRAKQVAETFLFTVWQEKNNYEFSATASDAALLVPSDIVEVEGVRVRITEVKQQGYLYKITGKASSSVVISSTATADENTQSGQTPGGNAPYGALVFLDIPSLNSSENQSGVHAGVTALGASGWPGGQAYQSLDSGANYNFWQTMAAEMTFGYSQTALADSGNWMTFDYSSTVTVVVLTPGVSLSSSTEDAVRSGANTVLLGNEVLSFVTATSLGNGTYTLSGLLRGRNGTEWAMAGHTIGERFVVLDFRVGFYPINAGRTGQTDYYKQVEGGRSLDSTGAVPLKLQNVVLKPFSPVLLKSYRDGSGDIILTWVRRCRTINEWLDGNGFPLDEAFERYELEIYNNAGSVLYRTETINGDPTFTYTAAMQTSDSGGLLSAIQVVVYQISAVVGRGYPCTENDL